MRSSRVVFLLVQTDRPSGLLAGWLAPFPITLKLKRFIFSFLFPTKMLVVSTFMVFDVDHFVMGNFPFGTRRFL